MNEKLKKLLIKHEGYKNKIYLDTKGIKTIGIGHNIKAKGLPQSIKNFLSINTYITDEMVTELFENDIKDATNDCYKLYHNFDDLSENRQNALIDFLFNVGYYTATTFKNTNKAINEERWEDVINGLKQSLWAKQVGKNRVNDIVSLIENG